MEISATGAISSILQFSLKDLMTVKLIEEELEKDNFGELTDGQIQEILEDDDPDYLDDDLSSLVKSEKAIDQKKIEEFRLLRKNYLQSKKEELKEKKYCGSFDGLQPVTILEGDKDYIRNSVLIPLKDQLLSYNNYSFDLTFVETNSSELKNYGYRGIMPSGKDGGIIVVNDLYSFFLNNSCFEQEKILRDVMRNPNAHVLFSSGRSIGHTLTGWRVIFVEDGTQSKDKNWPDNILNYLSNKGALHIFNIQEGK